MECDSTGEERPFDAVIRRQDEHRRKNRLERHRSVVRQSEHRQMLRPPEVWPVRYRHAQHGIQRGAVTPHRAGPLPQSRDHVDECEIHEKAANGTTRNHLQLPPLDRFIAVAEPFGENERFPNRKEDQPEEHQMHDRIVDIDHEEIPPIRRHRRDEQGGRDGLHAISDHKRPRGNRGGKKHDLERAGGHARPEKTDLCVPEQLTSQRVIDEPIGTAEIRHLHEEMEEIG